MHHGAVAFGLYDLQLDAAHAHPSLENSPNEVKPQHGKLQLLGQNGERDRRVGHRDVDVINSVDQ